MQESLQNQEMWIPKGWKEMCMAQAVVEATVKTHSQEQRPLQEKRLMMR